MPGPAPGGAHGIAPGAKRAAQRECKAHMPKGASVPSSSLPSGKPAKAGPGGWPGASPKCPNASAWHSPWP
eukprot:7508859-Alexandrium_andersonii.AAC.1